VAHGVFLLTILRGLAERLAPRMRQVSQQAMFPAPTYAGELMTFTAKVTSRSADGVHIAMSAIRRADEVTTCEALGVFRP
jgi:acyl dehydratase